MKRFLIILALGVLTLSSCVTARQFQELETDKVALEAVNDDLVRSNENIKTENKELEAKIAGMKEKTDALESDTTILGTSLRHMRGQYDKINELNEILSTKNSAMLNEQVEENRQLLATLNAKELKLQKMEDDLDQIKKDLDLKESTLNELGEELESRSQRLVELETLLAEKDAAANALKDKVAKALLSFKDKGLTVEEKDGKVYVKMEANLLFPSGSTQINAEGKTALIDLAKAIQDQKDLEIVVEGHTDIDKLTSSVIPRDNWELSVLRATAVVKMMVDNTEIAPSQLSATGRSEYHPVDPNDKSKNRRIEIVLSPDLGELFDIVK